MDKRTVKNNRSVNVQWHRRGVLKEVQQLNCPVDGTVLYQGPPPNFRAVSCPTCKAVFQVNRESDERRST